MNFPGGIYGEDRQPMTLQHMETVRKINTVGDLRSATSGLPDDTEIEFVHPSTSIGERAMLLVPRGQLRVLMASVDAYDCRDMVPED